MSPRTHDPPERPRRSGNREPGKRAARACTKPTSGHNLAFLIRARPPGRALARTTRPNELKRAPSNDPPERPRRSDKGEPGKRAARACTKPTSGHNLAFLIRARPPGRALGRPQRPARTSCTKPTSGALKRPARTTESKRQGRAGQTSCTSVHKANLGSQLSIFDTGSSARARPRPNDPPERVHAGALTTTKPTSGHNLAFLIRARPPGRALARTTRPNEFTRAPSNDPPERPSRSGKGEPGKRAGRACTKPTSGHNLAFFDTGSSARARPRPNDPPERVHAGALKRPARTPETKRQGRAGQTSCTSVHKANLGSQLSIFDTGSSARARPPPERPARTSSTGRPQTTRPNDRNEATRESRANELHERAQSQPRVTT
jgi:hypothetical protein